jgi:hypothetical protein
MKPALMLTLAVVSVLVFAAAAADKCDCPKEDFSQHGAVQRIFDSELSSAQPVPTSGPLGFAKTMTICMAFDQSNKGYPAELKLVAEGSMDAKFWFPLTIVGSGRPAETINGCLQVAPTRFVRVGWPPAANISAPGPHVTAWVQVSY